jgi:hypothetical protein
MKRASYLQRVARHLGATPVLGPPRRIWGVPRERVSLETDDAPMAIPTRVTPHTPSQSQPERTATTIIEAPEPLTAEPPHRIDMRDAAPPPATAVKEESVGEGVVVAPSAEIIASPPAPIPAGVEVTISGAEPAAPAARRTIAVSPARQPSLAATDAAALAPVAPRLRGIRATTPVSAPAVTPPQPGTRREPSRTRAATPRSAIRHDVERDEEAAEPATVEIGSIEVHVEPAPRRTAAPRRAAATPLAHGFLTTLGLRQE